MPGAAGFPCRRICWGVPTGRIECGTYRRVYGARTDHHAGRPHGRAKTASCEAYHRGPERGVQREPGETDHRHRRSSSTRIRAERHSDERPELCLLIRNDIPPTRLGRGVIRRSPTLESLESASYASFRSQNLHSKGSYSWAKLFRPPRASWVEAQLMSPVYVAHPVAKRGRQGSGTPT